MAIIPQKPVKIKRKNSHPCEQLLKKLRPGHPENIRGNSSPRLSHRMLVPYRFATLVERDVQYLTNVPFNSIAFRYQLLRCKEVRKDVGFVSTVRLAFVVVGGLSVIKLDLMKLVLRLWTRIGPNTRLDTVGNCVVVIRRPRVTRNDRDIEIRRPYFKKPLLGISDRLERLSGVTDRHERLDFEAVPMSDLYTTSVFFTSSLLVDVLQNSGGPRLKPSQEPPKSCVVHRLGLCVGKKLRLHKTTKAPRRTQIPLRLCDQVHQFNDFFVDIQLIIIKHEAPMTGRFIYVNHLLDNVFRSTCANPSKHR